MHRVFVYGTLKRGFPRHNAIINQTFLGLATTEPRYKLLDLGDYPGLVTNEDGQSIEGEVYLVSDECLKQLDQIECVAEGLYRRDTVHLLPPWHAEPTLTYIFLLAINGYAEIARWN